MRNLAIDRYRASNSARRSGSEYTLALDELAECIPDSTAKPESACDGRQLTEAINRFLAALPSDTRTLFVLRYWHMKSIKEIAAMHGCSESRVKMLMLRTRAKLKQYLESEGIEV